MVPVKDMNSERALHENFVRIDIPARMDRLPWSRWHWLVGIGTIVVAGDYYLLQLVRYIHRNPVRGGVADRPDLCRWSTLPGYLPTATERDWLYKDFFLFILSPRKDDLF